MKKIPIQTDQAPAAIGPYSQAIKIDCQTLLFASGQIPLHPENGEIVGASAAEQTAQVMKNLKATLEAGGSEMSKVVKTTVYLSSMDDFAEVNKVYGEFFAEPYPARATVEVSRLPKGVLVEIDAIASC